jgi:hypothetical protein
MTADNPAARVDLDALTEAEREALADLCDVAATNGPGQPGYCYHHHAPVEWSGRANAHEVCCERVQRDVAPLLAERLAPLLGELRDAREALADVMQQQPFRVAEANRLRAEAAEAERDEARAERDALRERIDHWCVEWSVSFPGLAEHLRAALADPGAS